jgi:hypothetical protein
MAGYSGTPLVRKLGIAAGTRLALISAPDGFERELVGLPGDVRILNRVAGAPELAIWFVSSRRELDRRLPAMAKQIGRGIWIAWPKRASGVATDLSGDVVRSAGLAWGLVDYKICAINDVWSGLKFARARSAPEGNARSRG